jgi:hypothetical protein
MTRVLQPLDRSINALFKLSLKRRFTQFLIDNPEITTESIDNARDRIVEDVDIIWNGEAVKDSFTDSRLQKHHLR